MIQTILVHGEYRAKNKRNSTVELPNLDKDKIYSVIDAFIRDTKAK